MPICPKCGKQFDSARFCLDDGARLIDEREAGMQAANGPARDPARRDRRPQQGPGNDRDRTKRPAEPSQVVTPPATLLRRRVPLAFIVVAPLFFVASAGGAYYLVRSLDLAHRKATAALPPDPAAPPGSENPSQPPPNDASAAGQIARTDEKEWTHGWTGKRYSYVATLSPRPLAVNETFQVTIKIRTSDKKRAKRLRSGKVRAEIAFQHDTRSRPDYSTRRRVNKNRLSADDVRLPQKGTYHVKLDLLLGRKKRLERTEFYICVGADPKAPAGELEAICPGMNAKKQPDKP
ncbi:MAG: hypothetical protein MJE77_43260 [Proteobacteria bacterium]|nr:hypothetical protein [Pseudomonadota bacterium]